MEEAEQLVADVIAAAGGEVVGRVRLQKTIYLLQRIGLEGGFTFGYHHYGPYSAELADAVEGAKDLRLIDEDRRRRQQDGVPYSVFASKRTAPERIGSLEGREAARALGVMNAAAPTVLELAATIHWLSAAEGIEDWRAELERRKGRKATPERVEAAVAVLRNLSLFE